MSENKYPEISYLPCNNGIQGRYAFLQNVVYSHTDEKSQYLTLICPWKVYQALAPQNEKILEEKYPLIIFVQGSGWTKVNPDYELPQLVDYAKQGYIVAAVSHRNCLDGYPYPAFIQDIKCAIRFLRKNAQKYCIDEKK